MTIYKPLHTRGNLTIENADIIAEIGTKDIDFGVQVANDGRVWVCINGVAWLRYKPYAGELDT